MNANTQTDQAAEIEHALGSLMQLVRIDHLHHWLSEHAGLQLDRPSYIALTTLARAGRMRLSDLAKACDVGPSTMSRLVERLLVLGLVEAVVSSSDRRALSLAVSEEGKGVLERLITARRSAIATIVAGWSEEDRGTFAALLRRFTESAGQCIKADDQWHKHTTS